MRFVLAHSTVRRREQAKADAQRRTHERLSRACYWSERRLVPAGVTHRMSSIDDLMDAGCEWERAYTLMRFPILRLLPYSRAQLDGIPVHELLMFTLHRHMGEQQARAATYFALNRFEGLGDSAPAMPARGLQCQWLLSIKRTFDEMEASDFAPPPPAQPRPGPVPPPVTTSRGGHAAAARVSGADESVEECSPTGVQLHGVPSPHLPPSPNLPPTPAAAPATVPVASPTMAGTAGTVPVASPASPRLPPSPSLPTAAASVAPGTVLVPSPTAPGTVPVLSTAPASPHFPPSPNLPPSPSAAPATVPVGSPTAPATVPVVEPGTGAGVGTAPGDAPTRAEPKLLELVGQGTYGVVYRGEYGGAAVAVKILSMQRETSEEVRHEIAMMRACQSEHIVAYRDAFHKMLDGRPTLWVVMEFAEHGSALDLIKRRGGTPLPEKAINWVCRNALAALHHMHSTTHAIHRDIKAANLLVMRDGIVKLADLGVAAQLQRTMSKRGTMIGTPHWSMRRAATT